MRLSLLAGAASLLMFVAVPASAQFTGVVVPPPAKAVVVADTVTRTIAERRDSASRVTITNMKDWVDSAAATLGVAPAPVPVPVGVADSLQPVPAAPQAAPTMAAPPATTEFREGAPAPNTATPVPTLALLGLLSLVAGLWLLRRRRA